MKQNLLTVLLMFASFSTIAKEPKTHLVVWAKDGTRVAYAFAERPEVSFTESDIVITTNNVKVYYTLEDFARFTYEDGDVTSITNLQTNKTYFELDGETLLFPALKANSNVSVSTLNGILLFSKTIKKDGEYSFPLSGLNNGVYLITVNGLTYKIQKK